jgi:hypothetical protein
MPTITRGSIVWAALRDPNGNLIVDGQGNPKYRPCVVISRTAAILSEDTVVVAAISTKFDVGDLPSNWFNIASQPGGHPETGLDQPSVVKADWLELIRKVDIDYTRGIFRCPSSIFRQVSNWADQNKAWPS